MRTSRYISVCLILMAFSLNSPAHGIGTEIQNGDTLQHKCACFPAWMTSADIRVDLAGIAMEAIGMGFRQYEAGVRIGIKNKIFPIFEMGYGTGDYTGDVTKIGSKTQAPYFRVGCDYNFTKKNIHDSRFTAGLRYGFSTYAYDLTDPSFGDKVWGIYEPFAISGDGAMHWIEIVAGVETRLWSVVHLGWNVRYKFRIAQTREAIGEPWYVPGFGTNDTTAWGANFCIIIEI